MHIDLIHIFMSATPRNNDANHVERMSELTRSVSTSILDLSRYLKTIEKDYMLREFVDNAYNVALTVSSVATGLGAPGGVVGDEATGEAVDKARDMTMTSRARESSSN